MNLMHQYAAVRSWSLLLRQESPEGRETKHQWEKAGTGLVQVMRHMFDNNLLSAKQFGFIGGRSTVLQLLRVIDE